MGEAGEPGGGPGLAVRATPRVRGVLERAAGAPGLDGALRARARAAAEAEAVPWALVDACCAGLRGAGGVKAMAWLSPILIEKLSTCPITFYDLHPALLKRIIR